MKMDKKCTHCEHMNNSDNQFCQNCGHKFESYIQKINHVEKKNSKITPGHRLLILIIATVSIALVIVLVNQLSSDDQAGSNEAQILETSETENIEDSIDDSMIEEKLSEPEILFNAESNYHGELDGYKSYEDPNSYTYEKNYGTLAELLGDGPINSLPPLSAVLTKVEEPIVFYITDSFRATTKANVHAVYIFHNNEVTTYSFHPNNYGESNPETIITVSDFIGKSVDEVIELSDQNQKKLFELTRSEIVTENQDSADLVYQYSQMDYISPKPQPFELIFSERYDGQLIRKYSKIQLENKEYQTDLMNEQLENFNDYHVTYNLLLEDKYYSINMEHDIYLLGFKTNETPFITIYEDRYMKEIRFDNENTIGIDTLNIKISK